MSHGSTGTGFRTSLGLMSWKATEHAEVKVIMSLTFDGGEFAILTNWGF